MKREQLNEFNWHFNRVMAEGQNVVDDLIQAQKDIAAMQKRIDAFEFAKANLPDCMRTFFDSVFDRAMRGAATQFPSLKIFAKDRAALAKQALEAISNE